MLLIDKAMKLSDWRYCEKIPVIYGILNIETNKWYIGSCHSMKDRMRRHYYYLKAGNHHSTKLQRAWNKYGEGAFDVHVLLRLNNDDTNNMLNIEESYIRRYNSKENGYNILDTCKYVSTFKLSQESASKAGETHAKAVVAINRFTNKVICEYNSITEAARDINESTSNISQVCKGNLRYVKDIVFVYKEFYNENKDYRVLNHHMKGVPKSTEWKEKARLSNKKAVRIYKYDKELNLIMIYSSRSFAEVSEGFPKEYLRRRLNREINGFIFTDKEIKDIV